jgi:hypothetical protein
MAQGEITFRDYMPSSKYVKSRQISLPAARVPVFCAVIPSLRVGVFPYGAHSRF